MLRHFTLIIILVLKQLSAYDLLYSIDCDKKNTQCILFEKVLNKIYHYFLCLKNLNQIERLL